MWAPSSLRGSLWHPPSYLTTGPIRTMKDVCFLPSVTGDINNDAADVLANKGSFLVSSFDIAI